MRKPPPIYITIPRPCSENWDEMTLADRGRFCKHCQKTVIDFTTWSDEALYNFFAKNKEHVCGRLQESQINRPINIPYQPHSRLYRMTIALGLTILVAQPMYSAAQGKAPLISVTDSVPITSASQVKPFGKLAGRIFDEKKEPLINATVMVTQNGTLKGGNVTDFDGNYTIQPLEAGAYDVIILYTGYDTIKRTIEIKTNETTKMDATESKSFSTHFTGVIQMGYVFPLIDHDNPDKKTISRDEIEHMPH